MRINGVGRKELQRFVEAVAGQQLSLREIELLAHGYFRGPASLRQAVDDGKWKWSLQQMQSVPADPDDCNKTERTLLRDQYGYAAFAANYYWVPGRRRDEVKVLEYADRLKICLRHTVLAEYDLPADGVREQRFSPPGEPKPRHQPKTRRRRDARREEQRLRALGEEVVAYLDFVYQSQGIQRHRFTRDLFALSCQLTAEVFVRTVERALRYRITDLPTLRRIAWLCLSQTDEVLPPADFDEDFQQRPAYQEGCLTDQPDLSVYDEMLDDNEREHGDPADDEPEDDEPENPNPEENEHGQDDIPF